MNARSVRKSIAAIVIVGGMFATTAGVASAEPVSKFSRSQLASACKANGGGSYGGKGAASRGVTSLSR